MFKTILRAWVLGAFLLSVALPAFGWDETGHKISAYIAWQRMTPDVRDRVIKILIEAPEDSQIGTFYQPFGSRNDETKKREYFMLMATWADIIRDRNFDNRYKKYHQGNWHYSDTFWTVREGQIVTLPSPEDGGKAIEKIAEFAKLIRGDAKDPQKAVAIAWLEHLIGDIHQPLHTSARVTDTEPKGDQGGNLFLLMPKGTPRDKQENLHWFWDSIIGRNIPNTKSECDADYLDPLAQKIMKKFPFDKMQGRLAPEHYDVWVKESLTAAQNDVFSPDLKRFEMPSDKYRKKAFKIAQERLALAGYRMGDLFNQVLGATRPN